jgi:glutathione S-transferase
VVEVGLVLYHRLADPASADVRRWIVERGLKSRVDFQNVDTEAADAFAALGGRRVPALWDGPRLHVGSRDIRLALGAIIAAEERSIT